MSARPDPCIFCDILAGRAPASFVYRDEVVSAFVDLQPVNPGHVLLVPNRHAADLAGLDPGAGAHLFRVAQHVAQGLRAAALTGSGELRCEGVNFFLADGEAAGQEVFHLHLHVIPRYAGDGFGFQFPPGYNERPDRAALDAVAARLRAAL
jgi:histidine triad (HIT) family protein